MNLIPVPELVLTLVLGLVIVGARTLWQFGRVRVAGASEITKQPQAADFDTRRKRAQLLASCVLMVVISIPLMLRVVPPNGVYGFRTSLTQSSAAIWYPANAFMGAALSAAAIVSAILLVILPATVKQWLLWATFLVPVSGAIVASFAYLSRLG
jgi:hypothetical protein